MFKIGVGEEGLKVILSKICESVHCEKEAKEALTLEADIFGLGNATEILSHVF